MGEQLDRKMECPICKKKAVFVGVHDDEGNYHGLMGCDYEDAPWSGLSYALHHEGWETAHYALMAQKAQWAGCYLIQPRKQSPPCPRQNEPLTIEQLREMDGEPVWCKWLLPEDRAIEQGKWFIVISGDKAGLEIKRPAEYRVSFCKIDDYGKTWLAYRLLPEGEEDT